jgi:hypothetical protein
MIMSKKEKDTVVITPKVYVEGNVTVGNVAGRDFGMESLNLSPVSSGVPMPVVQPPKEVTQNSTVSIAANSE